MRLKALLSCTLLALSIGASAQTWVNDSVAMGPGYSNDIYYSLRNGAVKTQPNTDWHLAFQMTPPGPYGNVSIWANHVMGAVQVFSLHKQASTSFATLTAGDTVGKTSMPLYNTDSSWNYGAFNRMNNPSNIYDYSWGAYDINSHNVNGDSLYLLKIGAAGTAYKVWIQQYVSYPFDSIKWQFRIAQMNGTGDTTIIMRQKDYANRLFGYYNVVNRTASDREPDRYTWDILFTRYIENVTQGPVTLPYPVTGVLSNFKVEVADVRGVNPDTAHYQYYSRTKKLNEIGSDWKAFNMATNTYVLDTTATYFIKDTNATYNRYDYWQLRFTRFDGGTTGKIVFSKRILAPVAVTAVAPQLNAWHLSPNPASGNAGIMIDAKEATDAAYLVITDMAGRTVQQLPLRLHMGINAYNLNTGSWAAGTYMIHLTNGRWQVSDKLVVVH